MKVAHPSNLELQVLSVLWATGGATVHEVLASLPDGKPRAYTTVLSILQKLEQKRLVRKKGQGRSNIYIATRARGVMIGRYLHDLVSRIFQGRATDLIEQILTEVTLTPGETKAVAGMLERPPGRDGGPAAHNKKTTMAVKKKTAAPAKKAAPPAKKAAAPAKKAAAPAKKAAAPAKKAAAAPAKKAAPAAPAPAKKTTTVKKTVPAKKAPAKKAPAKKAAKK